MWIPKKKDTISFFSGWQSNGRTLISKLFLEDVNHTMQAPDFHRDPEDQRWTYLPTLKVEIAALWGSVGSSHCTNMSLQSQTQPFSKQRMCINPVYQVWEGTTVVPNRFCLTSHLEEWKNYNSKKMKVNSRSLEPKGGGQSDYPKGVHSSWSKDL